jgi:hypothetical protein
MSPALVAPPPPPCDGSCRLLPPGLRAHRAAPPRPHVGLGLRARRPVGGPEDGGSVSNCRPAPVLRVTTMRTLVVIGLGTLLVLVALARPASAQRCLSFRPRAFFAGTVVAPGYAYPAYGYPVYPYDPYPLPPHRASASAGAASMGTFSSRATRPRPATRSPAGTAGSRRGAARARGGVGLHPRTPLGEMECPGRSCEDAHLADQPPK